MRKTMNMQEKRKKKHISPFLCGASETEESILFKPFLWLGKGTIEKSIHGHQE